MNNLSRLALGVGLAALVATPSAAETTLTISSWVSPQHPLTKNVLMVWAANVEKATNGRVKFQVLPKHPSAPPGTFDAVRDDLVDVSYVTASYTPARHTLPILPELPGAGKTATINSIAYNRIHWKYLDKVGEYKGVKLLGVFTHGPGQMFNTKRPINSAADVKGMKIRTGGGVADQMARELGASAFVKPAPESYELLSSGVADGVFFPMESIASFKLDSVIKYATLFPGGFYSSAFGFFMNEGKWSKLSKQDQDIIMAESGEKLARIAGKAWDDADQVGLAAMKKAGVQITEAGPAFLKDVQAAQKKLEAQWIQQATAKGVDGAAVLAAFRAELKKVEAEQK
jgi:TRAP-type C4-dicarboxylate transport system substrate-binding protein